MLGCGDVVVLADDLVGVQAPDGALVPPERLGPGLVQHAPGPTGEIAVHWLDANLDTWLPPADLQLLGGGRRLVTVCRCDEQGRQTFLRRRVVPLNHHWTVALLPRGVIRVVRDDGPSWTFTFNTLTRQVDPPWDEAPTDDAAEALVAADLALAPH
ncbi:MAG TPA: hypothetical protein VKY74_10280 [Chloroflexia bacterium]|nr:hypothetical protein [Chloroflexia bacterium]